MRSSPSQDRRAEKAFLQDTRKAPDFVSCETESGALFFDSSFCQFDSTGSDFDSTICKSDSGKWNKVLIYLSNPARLKVVSARLKCGLSIISPSMPTTPTSPA